jgi:hypothetical protein
MKIEREVLASHSHCSHAEQEGKVDNAEITVHFGTSQYAIDKCTLNATAVEIEDRA